MNQSKNDYINIIIAYVCIKELVFALVWPIINNLVHQQMFVAFQKGLLLQVPVRHKRPQYPEKQQKQQQQQQQQQKRKQKQTDHDQFKIITVVFIVLASIRYLSESTIRCTTA
jgi:predicted histidine transporter YuiF (NhaC family)